ncbi:MAG TPA: hypothetical protein PLD16_08575, partial [Fervidobacterium sp.]|nr:hypothetical protein [Fervidobacterium sp.]
QAVFLNFTTAAYELFELGTNIFVIPGFEKSWKWFTKYKSNFIFTVLNDRFEIPNEVYYDKLNKNAWNNNPDNIQSLIQNELNLLLKREGIGNRL